MTSIRSMNFTSKTDFEKFISETSGMFDETIGREILDQWSSLHEFIWDIHLSWFTANWRAKINPANKRDEALFLLLHNSRADLLSGIDSFKNGFIRGPALLVKSSITKTSAAIGFFKNDNLLKEFFGEKGMSKKLVEDAGKDYPEILRLYRFLESNYTHDLYASFTVPKTIENCEIDEHMIPPWIDYFLGHRWAICYTLHSALLILAQISDLFLHRGTNLWDLTPEGAIMKRSFFHDHIDSTKARWDEVNDQLAKKYAGRTQVRSF